MATEKAIRLTASTEVEADGVDLISVKLPREFWRMVSAIADLRRISRYQVLEKYAGQGIRREYGKVLSELNRDFGGEG